MPALVPVARPATPPLIARPVIPYSVHTDAGGGIKVLSRTDPVLRFLSERQDERTYRLMRETEQAIGNSISSLNALLLSFGWKVRSARSRRMSEQVKKLQALGDTAIARIARFADVQELMTHGFYDGWLPMQELWDTQAFMVDGRWRWGITRILEQPPEFYAFDPDENLVYMRHMVPNDPGRPEVFDDPAEKLGWLIVCAGSTSSPYGHALLRGMYLTWKVKQSFFEWYARGTRGAMTGVLKVIDRGPAVQLPSGDLDAGEGAEALAQLAHEAKAALRYLEEQGILVGRGGIDFDLITNIAFTDGWQKALDYLDMRMQVAIEGQQMSQIVLSGSGSRATTDNLSQVKLVYAQRLARILEPIINEQILARIIRLNVPNVDPDDMPRFRYRVHDRIDPEKAAKFVEWGGALDAEDLADEWNLPMASLDSPDRPMLRKQAAPSPFAPSNGPDEEDDEGEGGDDDPRRGRPIREESDDEDEAAKPRRGR